MSKHHRNRPRNRPVPASASAATTARRFIDAPAPRAGDDARHIRICPDLDPPPWAITEAPGQGQTAGGPDSRANAVKLSLRSKLFFTADMFQRISDLAVHYSKQLLPSGLLEEYLVFEMARSTAQDERCSEQLLVNELRLTERIGSSWDLDQAERAAKLGAQLAEAPQFVAGTLGRTKHGALYLINQLESLEEAIQTNGGLDEPQRHVFYDLLGIDPVYRNGSRQVPGGEDAPGLRALLARELSRHRTNLARNLNDSDAAEKKMAMLGIVNQRDSATKLLRADQNRARRRFSWAWDTLQMLKKGADPATLIDPNTGKPVAPGPRPTAVGEPVPPAPAAATAAPPPPPPSPPPATPETPLSPPMPALPEGLSADAREMWLVAAGSILTQTGTTAANPYAPVPTA